MKNLMLLLFVSFFEVYAQASKKDVTPRASILNDDVIIEAKRLKKPESIQLTHSESSITGTTCLDAAKKEFTPTDKGYRDCIRSVNRKK